MTLHLLQTTESLEPLPATAEDSHARRKGLNYFWLSYDTRMGEDGLKLQGLPLVPKANIHVASIDDRQAVVFLNPNQFPAIEYIYRLARVGIRKETSPSQREYVKRLNRFIHSNGEPNKLSFQIKDPLSPESSFSIEESGYMEDYSTLMIQPKGFGDEAKRPPQQPHVPLSSTGPKLQNLSDFLEAAPLSLTSHKIHREYGDRTTTREPPKNKRDTDHEYRLAVKSVLGIKFSWSFLEELTNSEKLDLRSKIRAMQTMLDAFHKDEDSTMNYHVTQAVHHSRNLIDFATRNMPQDDIRLAI